MSYHIPGIIKYERNLLQQYVHLSERRRKKQLTTLKDYLSKLHQKLNSSGISRSQLSINSQAALTTLEGLVDQHNDKISRYRVLYKVIRQEADLISSYRKKNLLLRVSGSSRLYHSVRIRGRAIIVQISLTSLEMPDEYFSLLMKILFSRLAKKPVLKTWKSQLLNYENNFQEKHTKPVKSNGRRLNPEGKYYNLSQIFQQLNRQYFKNNLSQPNIGWSQNKNRYRLGSYDHSQQKIIISKILDNRDIPEFVVDGIVYHEMLHQVHPIQKKNGRRIIHCKYFKIDEKKFKEHVKLQKWIKEEFPNFAGNSRPQIKRMNLYKY